MGYNAKYKENIPSFRLSSQGQQGHCQSLVEESKSSKWIRGVAYL